MYILCARVCDDVIIRFAKLILSRNFEFKTVKSLKYGKSVKYGLIYCQICVSWLSYYPIALKSEFNFHSPETKKKKKVELIIDVIRGNIY